MYFAILTGIENGRFYSSRTDDTLMKNDDFKFNFKVKVTLANCLFYALIISQKCLAFQFLTRGIRICTFPS